MNSINTSNEFGNNSCPGECHASSNGKVDTEIFRNIIQSNDTTVVLLTPKETLSLWLIDQQKKGTITADEAKLQWEEWTTLGEFTTANIGVGQGVYSISKLVKDLGNTSTRVYIKTYGGQPHIILKGYPGLRSVLNAPKYGLQNPKILQMGIGKYGAVKSAKFGGILTVIGLAAFRIVHFFLDDKATVTQLIGFIGSDIVKVGVSVAASIGAASLAAGTLLVGSFALGPLVVAVAVGAAVGFALDWLDSKLHITNRVIKALDQVGKFTKLQFQAIKHATLDLGRKAKEQATEKAGQVIDKVSEAAADSVKRYIVKKIEDLFWISPTPKAGGIH